MNRSAALSDRRAYHLTAFINSGDARRWNRISMFGVNETFSTQTMESRMMGPFSSPRFVGVAPARKRRHPTRRCPRANSETRLPQWQNAHLQTATGPCSRGSLRWDSWHNSFGKSAFIVISAWRYAQFKKIVQAHSRAKRRRLRFDGDAQLMGFAVTQNVDLGRLTDRQCRDDPLNRGAVLDGPPRDGGKDIA